MRFAAPCSPSWANCAMRTAVDSAIALDPREPWSYVLRGTIRSANGDAGGSKKDYDLARTFRILGEPLGDLDEEIPASGTASDAAQQGSVTRARHEDEVSEHKPSSSRTNLRSAEDFQEILKKMLFCKDRDWFKCGYFEARLRASEEFDATKYSPYSYMNTSRQQKKKSPMVERRPEPGRLDDLAALEAWGKRVGESHGGRRPVVGFLSNADGSLSEETREIPTSSPEDSAPARPKLVVVATSGGGITAAYWTAVCLTDLERRHHDFARHVRVITGASGGMVGAAEFVAGAGRPAAASRTGCTAPPVQRSSDQGQLARWAERRRRILRHLRRDSLTPVVRQMVLSDIPAMFAFGRQYSDRGQVLERVWERPDVDAHATDDSNPDLADVGRVADKGLGITFDDLLKGEQDGWRPSLIVSPMIIEGTQQLLISNLNLGSLGGGLEFFKQFRRAGAQAQHCLEDERVVSTRVHSG